MAETANETVHRQPRLNFWRPNKEKKGAMASVSYAPDKGCFFFSMMPESGKDSPKFDREKSINSKLNENDVGEILSVLSGRTDGLGKKNDKGYWSGLYHENASGTSIINLARADNGGYFLGLSVDRGGNKSRYNIVISNGEAEQLLVFFRKYLGEIFEYNSEQHN